MVKYNPISLGKRIRKLRESYNITREELAYILNLSDSYIGLIERGTRGITINNLVKIANYFNVPIGYFFVEDNDNQIAINRLFHIIKLIRSLESKNFDIIIKIIEDLTRHLNETQK